MFKKSQDRKSYKSDLTAAQWAIVEPMIPSANPHQRGGHPHHALDAWMAEPRPSWHIEMKMRPEGITGFTPFTKRWVVERTNSWHGRYRRNSKDYERRIESSTATIQISHIHLIFNRLAPCRRPVFHYRNETA
jgi:transposase